MSPEYDLIICFSEQDNIETDERKGWVTNMYQLLNLFFSRKFGFHPKVLLINNNYSEQIPSAKAYILVLTSTFIHSKECMAHLYSIQENISKEAVEEEYFPRFFKVLPRLLPDKDQSEYLMRFYNYYFFEYSRKNQIEYQFNEIETNNLFSLKTIQLGYDILDSMKAYDQDQTTEEKIKPENTVYLSLAPADQVYNRDILSRELQSLGYNVLPKYSLPLEKNDLERFIKSNLEKAILSVHIFGAEPGSIPNNSKNSIEDIQNILASEYFANFRDSGSSGKSSQFSRMVWIPADLNIKDENHFLYIENIKQDPIALRGAELIQTPIEILKTIVLNRLVEKKGLENKSISEISGENKKVYLIYDKKDEPSIVKVSDRIKELKIIPLHLEYDQNYIKAILNHRENLVNCDGVLIFYQNKSIDWLISKIQDIKKAPGFGRKKDFTWKVILCPPDTNLENYLENISFDVIKTDHIDDPSNLEQLIHQKD